MKWTNISGYGNLYYRHSRLVTARRTWLKSNTMHCCGTRSPTNCLILTDKIGSDYSNFFTLGMVVH